VLTAHFGYDNFYNEPKPMEALAKLGSSVPGPALADCLTAALCVRLGNRWGHSHAAQDSAVRLLDLFGSEQWQYYFNRVLPGDRHVLDKLAYDEKPLDRWQQLLRGLDLAGIAANPRIRKLLETEPSKQRQIRQTAKALREKIMLEP
jgi:hypothetical protein